MLNLLHVAVVSEDNLNNMIESGDCNSIEDCPFDIAQEYDYAQTALIDKEKNYIIYWNDNIHSDPDLYIEAFTSALEHLDIEYEIVKIVMKEEDARNCFEGEEY